MMRRNLVRPWRHTPRKATVAAILVAALSCANVALARSAVVRVSRTASMSGSCRTSDRHVTFSQRPGDSKVLVPGRPAGAVLCRYSGMTGARATWFKLLRMAHLGHGRRLRGLVGRMDAIPKRSAASSCPADDGVRLIVHFLYSAGPALDVEVEINGCRSLRNGAASRDGALGSGPAVIRELLRLTNAAG
jgi:hypothetical protein